MRNRRSPPEFSMAPASLACFLRRVLRAVIPVVLLAVPGACITSTHATLQMHEQAREVLIRRSWRGVTLGPCGLAGSIDEDYWIKLNGPGPVYSGSEVEFVTGNEYLPKEYQGKIEGRVELDASRKRVVVDLRVGGRRFHLNGIYRYREG